MQNSSEQELLFEEDYEHFAFFAGFTEGGVPFGITYSEMEEIEQREEKIKSLTDPGLKWADEQLKIESGWFYWDDDEEVFGCLEDHDESLID